MPDEKKPQIVFCPNCRQPATRIGNEITCEQCDAVFMIKRKEAAVKKLGSIENHEERLKRIEASIFPPDNPPESGDEPKPEPAEETGDILPR